MYYFNKTNKIVTPEMFNSIVKLEKKGSRYLTYYGGAEVQIENEDFLFQNIAEVVQFIENQYGFDTKSKIFNNRIDKIKADFPEYFI